MIKFNLLTKIKEVTNEIKDLKEDMKSSFLFSKELELEKIKLSNLKNDLINLTKEYRHGN